MTSFTVSTARRTESVEITTEVRDAVRASGLKFGACVVYCPHTTAGLTIQENADPDVVRDLLLWLNHHIPKDLPGFQHSEGNSDSHIKSSMIGSSVTIIIEDGALVLGAWQGVYFCEFDGPRADSNKVVALWHWAEDSSLIRAAIRLNDPPYHWHKNR